MLTEPEVYSMEDLVNVRNGDMKLRLKYLVDLCCRHTSECKVVFWKNKKSNCIFIFVKLCIARGFICEICHAPEVIFPWQMRKVRRCSQCGMCYHICCWEPSKQPCQKCVRISRRKESIGNSSSDNF
jgi:run domain Beclin-1 interacting cysteine-rich containing protein